MNVRHAQYAINESTAVKVFDGRGKVSLRGGAPTLYGSGSVSQSNGFLAPSGVLQLDIVSDVEIWALSPTGEGNRTVYVLAVD